MKISNGNTFYFLRYAHMRYMNSLFTNIQTHMLKFSRFKNAIFSALLHFCIPPPSIPPFCYWWLIMKKRRWKIYRSPDPYSRGYESAIVPNFQGIVFIWTQTYREIETCISVPLINPSHLFSFWSAKFIQEDSRFGTS